MDQSTLTIYTKQAQLLIPRYMTNDHSLAAFLNKVFIEEKPVLDIGCATGRDLALLYKQRKCNVFGIEPIPAFRKAAVNKYPFLQDRIFAGHLPNAIPQEIQKAAPFQVIILSAVLMHLPDSKISEAAKTLDSLSDQKQGMLLISVPLQRGDMSKTKDRDQKGRLMRLRSKEEYCRLFRKFNFRLVESLEGPDSAGRTGFRWLALSFKKS